MTVRNNKYVSAYHLSTIYIENYMIMAKQIIRLTESELHQIIQESVNRILQENGMQEGQGWNLFKKTYQDVKNGEYNNVPDKNLWPSRENVGNYINRGSISNSKENPNDERYYDENGDSHRSEYSDSKPINRGFGGKLGRAAGFAGSAAMVGAQRLGQKMKGALKK